MGAGFTGSWAMVLLVANTMTKPVGYVLKYVLSYGSREIVLMGVTTVRKGLAL